MCNYDYTFGSGTKLTVLGKAGILRGKRGEKGALSWGSGQEDPGEVPNVQGWD